MRSRPSAFKVQVLRFEETELMVTISSICTMMIEPPSTKIFPSLTSLAGLNVVLNNRTPEDEFLRQDLRPRVPLFNNHSIVVSIQ